MTEDDVFKILRASPTAIVNQWREYRFHLAVSPPPLNEVLPKLWKVHDPDKESFDAFLARHFRSLN